MLYLFRKVVAGASQLYLMIPELPYLVKHTGYPADKHWSVAAIRGVCLHAQLVLNKTVEIPLPLTMDGYV